MARVRRQVPAKDLYLDKAVFSSKEHLMIVATYAAAHGARDAR